jgi:hypothetical protein
MSTPTHLSEAKEAYLREGMRAYIYVNGAGAAALLAFLQAIWGEDSAKPLRIWVVLGIMPLAIGVAIGTLSFLARHIAWVRGASSDEYFAYRVANRWIPIGAVAAFVIGIGLPVLGALKAICTGT